MQWIDCRCKYVVDVYVKIHEENMAKMDEVIEELKRLKCIDKAEETAQSIISWLPVIGTLYDLGSAAAYAAKGCPEKAKSRAIDGAIGLALDAAVVATGTGIRF